MIRKIIAFAVLSGALAFAVLLILGKNYNPNSVAEKSPPLIDVPTLENKAVSPNITDEFTKKVSQDIVASKPTLADLPQPEELINQYIAESVKNFDYQSLKPYIKTEDLKIVNKTHPQLAREYLANLKQIIKDNFADSSLALNSPESAEWDILQKSYERAIADLYNLPVPQNLVGIHQKEIALLAAQKKIYQYLRNYQNDPLQAWLAIAANQNIDREFIALTQEINDFAAKNNL